MADQTEYRGEREVFVNGALWTVSERALMYDRRRGPMLVFQRGDSAYRVRNYPSNWMDLPDDQLVALCDRIR